MGFGGPQIQGKFQGSNFNLALWDLQQVHHVQSHPLSLSDFLPF
jgi:hypothetical protein